MKTFIIGIASIIALASFGSAAYANADSSNQEVCQIPPARPTGGATRERLQALRRCYEARSKEQQAPSTSSTQPRSTSSTEGCQIAPASPTVGGTRERLQTIQQCNEVKSSKQQTPSTSSITQPLQPNPMPSSTTQNLGHSRPRPSHHQGR